MIDYRDPIDIELEERKEIYEQYLKELSEGSTNMDFEMWRWSSPSARWVDE
ncbi:hypothetical protein LCGC14_1969470 [marine sediment metagenome]|uniref:Uncharacterized protein n=1 Tax=marine sediment metagenome TaxID=412755 RepID=A0A0F9I963_9ZZZZ